SSTTAPSQMPPSTTKSSRRTEQPTHRTRCPPHCASPHHSKDQTRSSPPALPSTPSHAGSISVDCNTWVRSERTRSFRSSTKWPRWRPASHDTARFGSWRRTGQHTHFVARGTDFSVPQYLVTLGAYQEFPIVDEMASLAAGISRNGSLRFVDANRNGLVDDGDRLDVNLAATGSPTTWDTYQLIIGGLFAAPETYVGCTRFILNGPIGPFDIPLPERRDSHVKLRYAGDTYRTTFTSKIDLRSGLRPAHAHSHDRFYLPRQ